MAHGTARIGKDHYRTEISVSGHDLVGDEGSGLGGQNLGPAPYDFLLAGLGACTAITLRMYADRKGWQLGTITADLRFKRDPEGNESIERTISFSETLSEEQMARIRDIIEKTPVTKTLKRGTPIATRFA